VRAHFRQNLCARLFVGDQVYLDAKDPFISNFSMKAANGWRFGQKDCARINWGPSICGCKNKIRVFWLDGQYIGGKHLGYQYS